MLQTNLSSHKNIDILGVNFITKKSNLINIYIFVYAADSFCKKMY